MACCGWLHPGRVGVEGVRQEGKPLFVAVGLSIPSTRVRLRTSKSGVTALLIDIKGDHFVLYMDGTRG